MAVIPLLSASAGADVPQMISYQGRVLVSGTNFSGTGQFKFVLVRGAGAASLWSNDGSSAGGSEPTASVSLNVTNGLVMTLLGDATLPNMTAIPPSVFTNADVRLRVWLNGGSGFQLLTPDQRIVSVGYAMAAETVPDGSITIAKLAPGVLNSTNLPANSITSTQLADNIALGATNISGRLDVYRTSANTPAITLLGSTSQISTYGSDGLEQTRLWGVSYGELLLNNSLANNATAVRLTAQGATGGQLELRNTNGSTRALLEGENTGGLLTLYQSDGNVGAVLYGNDSGAGALSLRNTNGSSRLRAYGQYNNGGGGMQVLNNLNAVTVAVEGDSSSAGFVSVRNSAGATRASMYGGANDGGQMAVYEKDGTLTTLIHNVSSNGVVSVRNAAGAETIYLWGRDSANTGSGQIGIKESDGTETVTIQAAEVAGDGAQIVLRKSDGAATITLDANQGTQAKITVAGTVAAGVVEITGGSDLSEKFDIGRGNDEVQPGMLVCIDPERPGRLIPSQSAYQRTAAGVVSGAGGVLPGMLMGQSGTLADGKHPVALTGRVYARVDASYGPIQPGDLITTSDTPGHGMKVKDYHRAQGAIVGKAMTELKSGKGLVLVLVTLQ